MRAHHPVALLVAGLALYLGSVPAHADCGAKNEFEDVYCYAKQYVASDDALNAAYKALTGKLDADTKAVLKKSQLAWIKQRNAECGSTDSEGYSVDLSCAVDVTESRTRFLKDRQAECDAGKCDAGKLASSE
jgi:uncharacterized protein YecT (DUF1311 family)